METETLQLNARNLRRYGSVGSYEAKRKEVFAYWGFSDCVVPGCKEYPKLHHFVPRRVGGNEDPSNLVPICSFHENPLHAAGYYARTGNLHSVARTAPKPKQKNPLVSRPVVRVFTPAPVARRAELVYGCVDCEFQFDNRPSYCGDCKVKGGQLSCIASKSLALKAYRAPELDPAKMLDLYKAAVLRNHDKYVLGKDPAYVPGRIQSVGDFRGVTQAYVDGFVRDVYVDTGEPVTAPAYRPPLKTKRKSVRRSVVLDVPPHELTLEEEHAAFERYRRERSKKKGKKPGNYVYGKALATNMAAPMIVKLRAQAAREARQSAVSLEHQGMQANESGILRPC